MRRKGKEKNWKCESGKGEVLLGKCVNRKGAACMKQTDLVRHETDGCNIVAVYSDGTRQVIRTFPTEHHAKLYLLAEFFALAGK